MAELTEQEVKEAADSLVGVGIWFIIEIVLYSIATLALLVTAIVVPIIVKQSRGNTVGVIGSAAGLVIGLLFVLAFLILFIIAFNAVRNRKKGAYPLMMAMLIISMFWVPVGTIVGAILLVKINNENTKKYLNYM